MYDMLLKRWTRHTVQFRIVSTCVERVYENVSANLHMSQNVLEHLHLLIITRSYPEDLVTAKQQSSFQSQLKCP